MDADTIKLIGTSGAQVILVAGYFPVFWLVRSLWKERAAAQDKILDMLSKQYDDASRRKDLWDSQGKLLDSQTRAIDALREKIENFMDNIARQK